MKASVVGAGVLMSRQAMVLAAAAGLVGYLLGLQGGLPWLDVPDDLEGVGKRPSGAAFVPDASQPAANTGARSGAARGGASALPSGYLAVGGGSFPSNTEVSLEQDLALFRDVFGDNGTTLFAGGAGTNSVRELRSVEKSQALSPEQRLVLDLGALFSPRQGRDSAYRESRLGAPAALREALLERLRQEFSTPSNAPLTLYLAAHGEQGETPIENSVHLWGGDAISVGDIAVAHRGSQRPLRLIVTSCFSGGFADLALASEYPESGHTRPQRCGLFAGTWDRETSGCDPNPLRREQESYAIYMLNALRGRDRTGRGSIIGLLDLDSDGTVNGLEAHAHARTESRSIDVPTSTSERYLRHVQGETAQTIDQTLREERTVRDRLGAQLGVSGYGAAAERFARLEEQSAALDAEMAAQEQQEEAAYLTLVTALLSRYPVLDDPYHPDFGATIEAHGAEIRRFIDQDPRATAQRTGQQRLIGLDARMVDLNQQQAMLLRYLRADETLHLAGGLRARGGVEYERYQALVACERGIVPPPK